MSRSVIITVNSKNQQCWDVIVTIFVMGSKGVTVGLYGCDRSDRDEALEAAQRLTDDLWDRTPFAHRKWWARVCDALDTGVVAP